MTRLGLDVFVPTGNLARRQNCQISGRSSHRGCSFHTQMGQCVDSTNPWTRPLDKKVFDIDLPEAGEKVFKGSGHGWVVTQQESGSIDVVNPLTKVRFPLPPRYKFADVVEYHADELNREYLMELNRRGQTEPSHLNSMHVRNYFIRKIILCSSPASNDFRAVALYGAKDRLAYCKLGDGNWCDLAEWDAKPKGYQDVTFCDGKLYAITFGEELLVCDDIVSCPEMRSCVPAYSGFGLVPCVQLIDSPNGLMAVSRAEYCHAFQVSFIYKTLDFVIFKLDMNSSRWIRMNSLVSDEILYMGLGLQVGISSRNFRGSIGNQILFVNYNFHFALLECEDVKDGFDNGIFNGEDRNITPLGYECNPETIWPFPIWFVPNLY